MKRTKRTFHFIFGNFFQYIGLRKDFIENEKKCPFRPFPSGGQCIDMTKTEAIKKIRSEVRQLAAAAATECLTMRRGKSDDSDRHALEEFDRMANSLAAPALQALEVLQGGAPKRQRETTKKPTKADNEGNWAPISPI